MVGPLRGTPLCVGPLWVGFLPCRVPVSCGICASSCLSLALTLSQFYVYSILKLSFLGRVPSYRLRLAVCYVPFGGNGFTLVSCVRVTC